MSGTTQRKPIICVFRFPAPAFLAFAQASVSGPTNCCVSLRPGGICKAALSTSSAAITGCSRSAFPSTQAQDLRS
jgi:hypothetical protein